MTQPSDLEAARFTREIGASCANTPFSSRSCSIVFSPDLGARRSSSRERCFSAHSSAVVRSHLQDRTTWSHRIGTDPGILTTPVTTSTLPRGSNRAETPRFAGLGRWETHLRALIRVEALWTVWSVGSSSLSRAHWESPASRVFHVSRANRAARHLDYAAASDARACRGARKRRPRKIDSGST